MTQSFTKQPRFTPEVYRAAMAAWDRGRFGPEWSDVRGMAARAGIIFPPDGDPDDSWAAEHPSQRAILVRAIRETPRLLRRAIEKPGARSWGDVVGRLLLTRDRWDDAIDRHEEAWEATKAARPSAVADVLATIADSLGVDR